jgi:GT2 family glycosyltransferase
MLSIIIVNWNVQPLLQRCLESIFALVKDLEFEVIVVDNCSQDASQQYLKGVTKREKRVKIILNNKNLGFAQANNQALKKAQGEYILFLNPDTEFIKPNLKDLLKLLMKNSSWGIIGSQLKGVDGQVQSSVRRFPRVADQVMILLKLHYLFFWCPILKNYWQKKLDLTQQQYVDAVDGSFILTRRSLLEKIGSFDEDFYLWFEDVDLCYRFKQAGYQVVYCPQFEILHHHGQSFGQLLSLSRQKIYNHSLLVYFKKHYSLKYYWPLVMAQFFSLFLAGLSGILSRKKRERVKTKLKIS